jgi:hypothetical protein
MPRSLQYRIALPGYASNLRRGTGKVQVPVGSMVLTSIDPEAYLREVLTRIADHLIDRIEELLPWNIAAS